MFRPETKILLVDDTKGIRILIKKCLLEAGYSDVTEAEGVDEALTILAEKSVELIVTDINMPEKTGIDLIEAVKKKTELSKIPIIVLSAETDRMTILTAIEKGADSYLLKPTTTDTIKKKFADVWNKHNS